MAKRKTRGSGRHKSTAARFWAVAPRLLAWAVVLSLVAVALWMGPTRAWRAMSRRPEFTLNPSALSFSDFPPWTQADVMAGQLSKQLAAALGSASIYEKDLCHRVQYELRACPWVLEVKRVRRLLPDKLKVEVVFREPAGLVEFAGRSYMIDADGFWLPDHLYRRPKGWDDESMPLIVNRRLGSPPPIARKWDGPALAVGARLCVFLLKAGLFNELPMKTIDVTRVGDEGREPDIVLMTRKGVIIKWGCSDSYAQLNGLTLPGWANPDSRKLEMLRSKLADWPELVGLEYIDVRLNTKISFRPLQQP